VYFVLGWNEVSKAVCGVLLHLEESLWGWLQIALPSSEATQQLAAESILFRYRHRWNKQSRYVVVRMLYGEADDLSELCRCCCIVYSVLFFYQDQYCTVSNKRPIFDLLESKKHDALFSHLACPLWARGNLPPYHFTSPLLHLKLHLLLFGFSLSYLLYLFSNFYIPSLSIRIRALCFQAEGRRRWPNLSLVFVLYVFFSKGCMLLWLPYGMVQAIIFFCCGFFCLLFFPRLISAVADWMYTILPHMVWP